MTKDYIWPRLMAFVQPGAAACEPPGTMIGEASEASGAAEPMVQSASLQQLLQVLVTEECGERSNPKSQRAGS